MKRIPLTQGQVALVDDRDYRRLSAFKWCAHWKGNRFYASRQKRRPEKGFIPMHRMLLPVEPPLVIDHINGNPLDNRRKNLRACTQGQNAATSRPKGGSSAYKGMWRRGRKWRARITLKGSRRWLGVFTSEVQAAKRYEWRGRPALA